MINSRRINKFTCFIFKQKTLKNYSTIQETVVFYRQHCIFFHRKKLETNFSVYLKFSEKK